jgi:hypothetical protein
MHVQLQHKAGCHSQLCAARLADAPQLWLLQQHHAGGHPMTPNNPRTTINHSLWLFECFGPSQQCIEYAASCTQIHTMLAPSCETGNCNPGPVPMAAVLATSSWCCWCATTTRAGEYSLQTKRTMPRLTQDCCGFLKPPAAVSIYCWVSLATDTSASETRCAAVAAAAVPLLP